MSTIEVKNTAGEKVADLELTDAVYGIEPNIPVMHQCVHYLMAKDRRGTHSTKNRSAVSGGGKKPWRQKGTGRARQGSIRAPQWRGGGVVFGPTPRHSTKNRSAVSGGGKKPWRQKGTGRARQGSIRAPQWRGGGVVFGPTPRDHSFRMNKKEIKLAMRSALSAKLADSELLVIDSFAFEKPHTKDAISFIKNLGLENKRITLVLTDEDILTALSFRNIPEVTVLFDNEIDTYFMLDNHMLVLAQPVAARLGEVLA